MAEALRDLKARGYRLGILTSNLQENVEAFLETEELQDLFEFVRAGITVFGKSRSIRRALRTLDLSPAEVIYLGDETRDIEAAHRSRVWAIAVGWGFNSRSALLKLRPDALVDSPQEIAGKILQLGEAAALRAEIHS